LLIKELRIVAIAEAALSSNYTNQFFL